jgi:uroporphyrinogen decarboxylase
MRQAGRYMPAYRALRQKHGFWDVCKNPELSTEVAMQPIRRFDFDASIVFSDILVVPDALGLGVTFAKGEGPVFSHPLREASTLDTWNAEAAMEKLVFVPNAVHALREAIGTERALLGFAGAPWTLFCYCVEGQGSDDFRRARVMLHAQPELATRALSMLADITARLLVAQVHAGADAVQIFDTWGGLLSPFEYERFAIPALKSICDKVQAAHGKVILFVRAGHHLLPHLETLPVDGVSLDWRTPWKSARSLFPTRALQGNLDPLMLLAPDAEIRAATKRLLGEMGDFKRSIFNLGHGIVPETPEHAVDVLLKAIRS